MQWLFPPTRISPLATLAAAAASLASVFALPYRGDRKSQRAAHDETVLGGEGRRGAEGPEGSRRRDTDAEDAGETDSAGRKQDRGLAANIMKRFSNSAAPTAVSEYETCLADPSRKSGSSLLGNCTGTAWHFRALPPQKEETTSTRADSPSNYRFDRSTVAVAGKHSSRCHRAKRLEGRKTDFSVHMQAEVPGYDNGRTPAALDNYQPEKRKLSLTDHELYKRPLAAASSSFHPLLKRRRFADERKRLRRTSTSVRWRNERGQIALGAKQVPRKRRWDTCFDEKTLHLFTGKRRAVGTSIFPTENAEPPRHFVIRQIKPPHKVFDVANTAFEEKQARGSKQPDPGVLVFREGWRKRKPRRKRPGSSVSSAGRVEDVTIVPQFDVRRVYWPPKSNGTNLSMPSESWNVRVPVGKQMDNSKLSGARTEAGDVPLDRFETSVAISTDDEWVEAAGVPLPPSPELAPVTGDITAEEDEKVENKERERDVDRRPLELALPDVLKNMLDGHGVIPAAGGKSVDGCAVRLNSHDFSTLRNGEWLNDEIINEYFSLIAKRGNEAGFPKVHVFNTFFYKLLSEQGYNKVKRWTKKINIFELDYILIPIHLGMHWALACMDMKEKEITYYDSFHNLNHAALKTLLNYVEEESSTKNAGSDGWKVHHARGNPTQRNGSDCGVFVCMAAEYLARGASLTFSQQEMPRLRRHMAAALYHGKL